MESQVIELRADDSRAKPAFDRINESLSSIEQKTRQLATRARQSWDDFTQATVRAMRSAGQALSDFARRHQELVRDIGILTVAIARQHVTLDRVAAGYKVARLVISPYTTAIILAAEATALLTLRQGRLIQEQARAAAQARLTAREYQILANTAASSGTPLSTLRRGIGAIRKNADSFEDFGVATTNGPYGLRSELDVLGEAQARLSRIRDPFARESRRVELGLPEGIRSDFNESVQSARLFGSVIGPEGAIALDRFRQGAIGIKDGFLDAARAVKVFAGSLLKDAAEGFALVATKASDLFAEFRQQSANDPRGRTGLRGARGGVQIPGARALFGITDTLDPRRAFGATEQRGALGPDSFTKTELEEQLALGKRQRAQIDREAEQAREAAINAERRSLELLAQARAKDGGEIAQIQQKYAQYRTELGKTTTAVNALREAERLEIEASFKAAAKRFGEFENRNHSELRSRTRERDSGRFLDRLASEQAFDGEVRTLQRQAEVLALSPNGEAEFRRNSALQGLDTQSLYARTVGQKVAIEQQKLQVEQQFIQETSRLRAEALRRDYDFEIAALEIQYQAKLLSEQQFQAKRAALTRIQELNQERLGGATQQQLDEARGKAALQQTQIVRAEINRTYEAVYNGASRIFASLAGGVRSFGEAIKSMLITAILTPLQHIVSTGIANLLTGERRSYGFGGGGGGGSSSSGGLGGILGALGMGGGSSGLGSVFTGGFAGGPGAAGVLGRQGYIGASGIGAKLFGGTNLGLLGLGGSALGLMGSFKLGQSDNNFLKSLAIPAGAVSGLVGFGSLSYLFPSLIAAGPVGWIAAAGIGAAIGLMGMFRKTADQKAVQKVKEIYGVTINKDLAQVIIQQAKSMGGLDIAIHSPQIRELIEMYAMATGQRIGAGNSVRPVSLMQSNGMLYQQSQMVNQQPYIHQSPLPTFGGGSPLVFQIQLSAQGTQAALEGQVVSVVANQRVATSQAVNAPLEWARTVYAG